MNSHKKKDFMYSECSSKDGINVEVPFDNLANDIIKKIREKQDNEDIETVEQKLNKLGERNDIERKREKEVKCC